MVPLPNLSSASLNRPAHFISHRLPLDMSLLPQLSQHTKPGTILRWSDLSASDGFDNYQVFGSLVTPPSPDNPCECTVRFNNGMATMSLHHLSIADHPHQRQARCALRSTGPGTEYELLVPSTSTAVVAWYRRAGTYRSPSTSFRRRNLSGAAAALREIGFSALQMKICRSRRMASAPDRV